MLNKNNRCTLWNMFDTLVYAIIPFVITFLCSIIIIVQVCRRRRSTVILGGTFHRNRDLLPSHDQLSSLLISINIIFIVMTGPFNICLVIQSIVEHFFVKSSVSTKIFLRFNEYLSLLQNAYHAISFLFYCVIGNKFRTSAKAICRRFYYELIACGVGDRCSQASLLPCCLDRRRSSSSVPTASTNSRLSNNDNTRRICKEHETNTSMPLRIVKRTTYVTFESITKPLTQRSTPV